MAGLPAARAAAWIRVTSVWTRGSFQPFVDAHGHGEVPGADHDHVEVGDADGGVELPEDRVVLEDGAAEDLLVGLPVVGGPRLRHAVERGAGHPHGAPDAPGRVSRRLRGGLHVGPAHHVGDDDAARSLVEVLEDLRRVVLAHAHQRGHPGQLGGADQLAGGLDAEAAVLAVDEHEVVAEVAERLHQLGAVDRDEGADHTLAGPQLGLEAVRTHESSVGGPAQGRAWLAMMKPAIEWREGPLGSLSQSNQRASSSSSLSIVISPPA